MKQIICIFSGILVFSFGNLLFAIPNHITPGGITGLSNVFYYAHGMNIGLSLFLLNLPIFIIAWLIYRKLVYRSLLSMFLCSVLTGVFQSIVVPWGIHNIVIGCLFGGTLMGLGLGIIGISDSSLGGGTLVGKLLQLKYGFSFSLTTLLFDSLVYPISFFVIGAKETFFSLLLSIFSASGIRLVSWALAKAKRRKVTENAIGELDILSHSD
ncbi:YitT family protein [Paenibacillus solisilvae]|uniref:YitT family protein n=1 Tax=Paenibacillus solisilvae TaxID=2486751 RepID=A0ABW0VXD5_9BACL